MGLVAAAHTEALGEASISYRDLRLPGFDEPEANGGGGGEHADDEEAIG